MKLALCSTGKSLESALDERFGRAAYIVFFDTETSETYAVENTARVASGGAGALAVQLLVDHKVDVLIAPETGPQAFDALKNFKITSYKLNLEKTVKNAIEAWVNGDLIKIEKAENKGLHRV